MQIVDIANLQQTSGDVSEKVMNVINKYVYTSFCDTGADHVLEHLNCAMKFAGGLCGYYTEDSAQSKFFIISPKLA